ncbi:M20/M25/M40 family metallo-hydrolase [Colwellia psychrerythraea]|uniref:Peptidase M28 n=1 Tax=Colwellia psychrerythraea TaxID=28229 RepID=A0A099L177_COLPS|nr:M20/M25/M40 family metallo-hydrolase [Colwellia psychrerythraea]KGJ95897.1 peptidase M28 [Colwellia psychrerythraea]
MSPLVGNAILILTSCLYLSSAWGADTAYATVFNDEANQSVLEHLKTLSSDEFSGRKFSSKTIIHSQSYLVATLEELGVSAFKNNYRHSFQQSGLFQNKQGTNIIGYVPGTLYRDRYIVLSAHYDHLGIKRNKIYNGADDNASGTAALLHYAKLLKQAPLKHSIILLFTDGEEVNLLGAKAFINDQESLLTNFKLNINLDMIAGSKRTKRLRFISKNMDKILPSHNLAQFINFQSYLKENSNVNLTAGFKRSRGVGSSINRTNWLMASDHGVFNKAGIPFIYFGVGVHKNYHSERDDYANINHDFYLSAVDVIFQQLSFLDGVISDNTSQYSH